MVEKLLNNLYEMGHCMICGETKSLQLIGHHRDGHIVGFFFTCNNCIDILRNGELRWELIPSPKGLEIIKGDFDAIRKRSTTKGGGDRGARTGKALQAKPGDVENEQEPASRFCEEEKDGKQG